MRFERFLILTAVCALGVSAGCATNGGSAMTSAKAAPPHSDIGASGFLNKSMVVDGVTRYYVVYVPREYTPKKAWPLVVFLHGAGERGDDGLQQSDVGIGRAIRFHPERFPCVVVMPQCPKGVWWDAVEGHIDAAMAAVLDEYVIDPDRVYLTGLSMGGFGTWGYGAKRVDTFAALLPICGGGLQDDAEALATVPIWAFHGGADKTVPPGASREMVEVVTKAGGNVEYTEYPKVGHNSWDKAYGDAKAIKWLLKQRKKR